MTSIDVSDDVFDVSVGVFDVSDEVFDASVGVLNVSDDVLNVSVGVLNVSDEVLNVSVEVFDVSVVVSNASVGVFDVSDGVFYVGVDGIFYIYASKSKEDKMNKISARELDCKELNEQIRGAGDAACVDDCLGQRFICSGMSGKNITINGTPGNALGAYLNGGVIEVNGNAQDAVGDTMNEGRIIVHGSAGDALGYAMRGGSIFVEGDSGYRTGIHMKEYKDKKPTIIIGGKVGSFLGEYLAGGLIIVLGIGSEEIPVGNFTGTGMHGGKIFIRTDKELASLPEQVVVEVAKDEDLKEIAPYVSEFSEHFGGDAGKIMKDRFYVLKPNAKNPYKQLYTAN